MTDHLSATFSALADPTRRALLARLATGAREGSVLAEPFEMSMPAVSKHLKVLERAGLIARGREAQWRPCRLEAEPLREVADWVERYREIWEQRLDRLDKYLRELQANNRGAGPASARRNPAELRRGLAETASGREGGSRESGPPSPGTSEPGFGEVLPKRPSAAKVEVGRTQRKARSRTRS
jgi:DNA-binding transcriptional ArsR family regulator